MQIFQIFRNLLLGDIELFQKAANVANACEARVWQLVAERGPALSSNELRGYVRVRAAVEIQATIASDRTQEPMGVDRRQRLQNLASDELISRMEHRVEMCRRQPALRRAA